jgi:hypothetical protein
MCAYFATACYGFAEHQMETPTYRRADSALIEFLEREVRSKRYPNRPCSGEAWALLCEIAYHRLYRGFT